MTRRDITLVRLELMWETSPQRIADMLGLAPGTVWASLRSFGATDTADAYARAAWQQGVEA